MTTRKRSSKSKPTDQEAKRLCDAIRSLGDYEHVRVRAERGHVNIYPDEYEPVARFSSSRWRPVQTQFPQAHWTLGTYALRR